MVDVDLHDIQILTSQDIDFVKVSYVKEVESQNTSLRYGLIISGVFIIGFITYIINKQISKKDK